MNGPPDLRDLLGPEVPPEELERLSGVDALLRAVPAPPARTPAALDARVLGGPPPRARRVRRRWALLAGTLAPGAVAAAFLAGAWLGGDGGFRPSGAVALRPTAAAPARAGGVVRLGSRDGSGNLALELRVTGLPRLARGHYELGLVRPGGRVVLCGAFETGAGTTTVRMGTTYAASEHATWFVRARPGVGARVPLGPRLLVGRSGS